MPMPDVGDVIALFDKDDTETSALVMAVEDDGSLVIQMPDGETLQIWISPIDRTDREPK